MDKSFNDQELSDIMKEIEALEEDFTGPEEKASPVMEELEATSVAEVKPVEVVAMDSYRKEAPKASGSGTSMSFKVQGNMALDLEFNIGGKVVSLGVTESGLTIEMEGGVKFTVPVSGANAGKKAA